MEDQLITRLREIKANTRRGHEALVQFKIPKEMRDALFAKLEADDLTAKDLFISAIEIYLSEKVI